MVVDRGSHPGCRAERLEFALGGFRFMDSIRQFLRDEDGQDVVEYGLLIATIAIIVLVGVNFFGSSINDWFHAIGARITTNT